MSMVRSIMTWHGDEVKDKVLKGAAAGLSQWAKDVGEAAQAETPVAEAQGGFTRDSLVVDVDEEGLRAAVSFDSPPGTHLAVWVHENMSYAHTTGKAKFLEDPLNDSKKSGPQTVAEAIKAAT